MGEDKRCKYKKKLVLYNSEDCKALEKTADLVYEICQRRTAINTDENDKVIFTDLLKRESPYRLGTNKFSSAELEQINKAAYWDYQRNKIYIRSSND